MGRNGQGDAPPTPPPTPVDLELDWVLGKMPRKVCGVGGEAGFLPSLPQLFRQPLTLQVLCPLSPTLPQVLTPIVFCCRSSSSKGSSLCYSRWPCPQG